MSRLITFCISNDINVENIDQWGLHGRNMVNILKPLTALLGWDK